MATVKTSLFLWVLRVFELMEIEIGDITPDSKLGESPLALSDLEINVELRDTLNEMFEDIIAIPTPSGTWNGGSTVGDIVKVLTANLRLKKIDELRDFLGTSVDETLGDCGSSDETIPVSERPGVRDCANDKLRKEPYLLRPIALADLQGKRDDIIQNVLKRMLA